MSARLLPVVLCALGCGAPPPPSPTPSPTPSAVRPTGIPLAVTLDDLPYVGDTMNGATPAAALQPIVETIARENVPVTGFVTCSRLGETGAALKAWLGADLPVANHSTAHRSVDDLGREAFVADARACRDRLATISGKPPTYFRYPMLQTGADKQVRDDVAADIDALGMRRAPVTIDVSDWALANAYAKAVDLGDAARAASIADAYVEHVRRSALRYRRLARDRVGRDPAQILLLHANSLATHHLGRVLATLRDEGFRFVSLDEALRDPLYARPDDWVDPVGASWLLRIPPAMPEQWGWDRGQRRGLQLRFGVANNVSEAKEERIGPYLRAQRLASNAWRIVHTEAVPANALVFQTASGETVLADTPWTPLATSHLLDWIVARFGALPALATVSHFHLDAAGGIATLQAAGIPLAISDRTAALLKERGEPMRAWLAEHHGAAFAGWKAPLPKASFPLAKGFTTRVGNTEVRVLYPGHGHAPDNVVTWFPESGVLFGGCMVKGGENLGNLGDANRDTWPQAMRTLQTLQPKLVIPGHGTRTDPEQLAHTEKLLEDGAPGI